MIRRSPANLLDRQFVADAPNQRWVGDTTEFLVGERGKLYLAAILDLLSPFVVSVSDSQNSIDLLGGRLRSVVGPIVRLHSPRRVAVRAFGTNHIGKSG